MIIIINIEKCNVHNNPDLRLDFTFTIHQIFTVPTYINYGQTQIHDIVHNSCSSRWSKA